MRSRRSISTTVLAIIVIVIVVVVAVGAYAAYTLMRKPAPTYITIGVVYDSTGSFATSSMPQSTRGLSSGLTGSTATEGSTLRSTART